MRIKKSCPSPRNWSGKLNFLGARDRLRDVVEETKLIYSALQRRVRTAFIKPGKPANDGSLQNPRSLQQSGEVDSGREKRGLSPRRRNHAQGVAFRRTLGVAATIVMRQMTPIIKVERTNATASMSCWRETSRRRPMPTP